MEDFDQLKLNKKLLPYAFAIWIVSLLHFLFLYQDFSQTAEGNTVGLIYYAVAVGIIGLYLLLSALIPTREVALPGSSAALSKEERKAVNAQEKALLKSWRANEPKRQKRLRKVFWVAIVFILTFMLANEFIFPEIIFLKGTLFVFILFSFFSLLVYIFVSGLRPAQASDLKSNESHVVTLDDFDTAIVDTLIDTNAKPQTKSSSTSLMYLLFALVLFGIGLVFVSQGLVLPAFVIVVALLVGYAYKNMGYTKQEFISEFKAQLKFSPIREYTKNEKVLIWFSLIVLFFVFASLHLTSYLGLDQKALAPVFFISIIVIMFGLIGYLVVSGFKDKEQREGVKFMFKYMPLNIIVSLVVFEFWHGVREAVEEPYTGFTIIFLYLPILGVTTYFLTGLYPYMIWWFTGAKPKNLQELPDEQLLFNFDKYKETTDPNKTQNM